MPLDRKIMTDFKKIFTQKILPQLPRYALFLVLSFFITATAWTLWVLGYQYYCNDSVPLLDFTQYTFVHGPEFGDYFITSARTVYTTWWMFIGLIFLTPLLIRWLETRQRKTAWKIMIPIGMFILQIAALWYIALYFSHPATDTRFSERWRIKMEE